MTGTAVENEGLNRIIIDRDLAVIARDHLTDWESLAPFLGLSRAQEQQVARSYPGDYGKQGQECLQIWRKIKGAEATYQVLITAAVEAKDQQLADAVKNRYGIRADDGGEKSSRTCSTLTGSNYKGAHIVLFPIKSHNLIGHMKQILSRKWLACLHGYEYFRGPCSAITTHCVRLQYSH